MPLRLGDYDDVGNWYFIAVCGACSREVILKPVGILARAGTGKVHRGMNLSDLEALLCCRDCRCRMGRKRSPEFLSRPSSQGCSEAMAS